MKGTVLSNDGEVAIVQMEDGQKHAVPRSMTLDWNGVPRPFTKEEFLKNLTVGMVQDGLETKTKAEMDKIAQEIGEALAPKFVLKKLADPGPDSDWVMRIIIQLGNLSKMVIHGTEERAAFEKVHLPLLHAMRECYDAKQALEKFIAEHQRDVAEGRGVTVTNGGMQVPEVNHTLRRLFKDFFVKARAVLYVLFGQKVRKGEPATSSVTSVLLGCDISFVQIEKDAAFEKEEAKFLEAHPGEWPKTLMTLIRHDYNTWGSALIDLRNTIIHDVMCPVLDDLQYIIGSDGGAGVILPRVDTTPKVPLLDFVQVFWDNLLNAVEEIVIVCFAMKLSPSMIVRFIPEDERDPACPFRYGYAWKPTGFPDGKIGRKV